MDNLIFSLNATLPIFLTMVVGIILKKLNIFNDNFLSSLNKFVFTVALPILLFQDISSTDFIKNWDTKFVIFCFIVTLLSVAISYLVSMFLKDKSIQGEFVQASYRSSASIIGIAFVQNIYGNISVAPLMIIGAVPLYNIVAVIVLSFLKPTKDKLTFNTIKSTIKDVITNPIILGILIGMIWSILKIPKPTILDKTLISLANLATPLGLIVIGAGFNFKKAFNNIKPALICSFLKLLAFCALFLPLAVYIGYKNEYLVNILVMLGSATTVSCYIMAKNMGHEGILTSNAVMLTTMLSSFTLTGWLFILKSMGLI
ncbi:AEC family transporter [Anaerofustis stercorihominis]|nr:AEC family transporter [Anaerofustis stercorihominis]MCQ4795834.1 AEC family transporter [Anaerofustis stercorihominis]RGD75819.1 AEC family transporter [Anaerofustis stercorihominis]